MNRLGGFFLGPNDGNQGIYIGDAFQLGELIPDNSVSLILCDPVYWNMEHYAWLDRFGYRVLVPGGNLVAQCGNMFMRRAIRRFRKLTWVECINEYIGRGSRIGSIKVVNVTKPHIWFCKGRTKDRVGKWLMNWISSPIKSKEFHKWGDGSTMFRELVLRLSDGGIVVDPFTGGGTVPAVAKGVGVPWIAFENDAITARVARLRVACAPEPLTGMEYSQLELIGESR